MVYRGRFSVTMTPVDDSVDALREPRYTMLATLCDEIVMRHLAEGNQDALAVIFDRYQRLVIRIAMQILRDPAEAEDVMQSVFIAILETARKFDPARGTLRVWVLQQAYHHALNRRRYLSVRGAYNASSVDLMDFVSVESTKKMSGVESARLVQQALNQLSGRQRQTLELAFYDGLTMHEIAERTGESYVNTRHHYYRGLEKLRVVLDGGTSKLRSSPGRNEENAYARP